LFKELLPTGERPAVNNFNQLKPRLVNLLINALQVTEKSNNLKIANARFNSITPSPPTGKSGGGGGGGRGGGRGP